MIKKILRAIRDEFIYGEHLTSLAAVGVIVSTVIIFSQKISVPLLIIGYIISQIVYFHDHYKGAEKDFLTNPERVKHIKKFKNPSLLLVFFYFLLLFFFLINLNNLKAILVVLLIGLGGLLFTDIFKRFTKKIIGFKNFYTAFFWALLILLAGFYYGISFALPLLLLFLFTFLRILADTIFCDIKDIKSDKKEGLKTFPVFWGKSKTLNYLHVVNAISFTPIIIGVWANLLPLFSLSLLVFYFYSFYYLEKAKDEKINIYRLSYIIVDGEQFSWPFVLLLGKLFI